MRNIIRSALLAGGVATLAACNVVQPAAFDKSNDPKFAKATADQGTAFQRSLHQGYSSFGQWEFDQADYRDAKGFNDRAMLSARGQQVNPVDPTTRNIEPQFMGELVSARANLMQHLGNPNTLARVPGPAGAAQVYYDCWAEQQEENIQPEHIAFCKNGFNTAMSQLPGPPVAQAPAPQPPIAQAPQAARPYLVFFDWDKSNLGSASMSTIDEIARVIGQGGQPSLRINGHADKSGTNPYNDALSQRRAEAVMSALSGKGVARSRAQLAAFGETQPLVNTADNVREPQNRRVEVIVR